MNKEEPYPSKVQEQNDKTVVFAVNPKSGAGNRGNLIEDCLQAVTTKGFKSIVETSIDDICDAVKTLQAQDSLQAVVSVGGDGTLGLLANHLPAETPFCVLPLGTENIVAKHLGFKRSAKSLLDAICAGREARWDVGVANGRSFLAILGVGFDAAVVAKLHAARRGHISYFSYVSPILRVAASYNYPEIKVTCWPGGEQPVLECNARWVFIANLARYALALDICPDAKTDDGLLHGVFLSRSGLLSGLRYLWKIKAKTHLADPSVIASAGIKFRLESEESVPFQLDGDPGGVLPVDVSVLPRRLRFLVPPNFQSQR
jgi:diacylglycerol kinase (ATP)